MFSLPLLCRGHRLSEQRESLSGESYPISQLSLLHQYDRCIWCSGAPPYLATTVSSCSVLNPTKKNNSEDINVTRMILNRHLTVKSRFWYFNEKSSDVLIYDYQKIKVIKRLNYKIAILHHNITILILILLY